MNIVPAPAGMTALILVARKHRNGTFGYTFNQRLLVAFEIEDDGEVQAVSVTGKVRDEIGVVRTEEDRQFEHEVHVGFLAADGSFFDQNGALVDHQKPPYEELVERWRSYVESELYPRWLRFYNLLAA